MIINAKSNRSLCGKIIVSVVGVLSCYLATCATVADVIMLDFPQKDIQVSTLFQYKDANEKTRITYEKNNLTSPNDFFQIMKTDSGWTSPVSIFQAGVNQRTLHTIKKLSNGVSILLMSADLTDYKKVFNITDSFVIPDDENARIIPGMDNADLNKLLNDNQRLYVSFNTDAGWSNVLPIRGTQRALRPQLAVDLNGGALIVYSIDLDNSESTITDRELYAVVYKDHLWSDPLRLSNNTGFEYGVKLIFYGNQYHVVWFSDADGNLSTHTDKSLMYSAIDNALTLKATAPLAVSTNMTSQKSPLLHAGELNLGVLWVSNIPNESGVGNQVFESMLTGRRWSVPVETGLHAKELQAAKIYQMSNSSLLVYRGFAGMQVAYRDKSGWSNTVVLDDFVESGVVVGEIDHILDNENTLSLIFSGHTPQQNITAFSNEDAAEGIYYTKYSILPDLALKNVTDNALWKEVGQRARIQFQVINKGFLPSGTYKVIARSGSQTLQVIKGLILKPGASNQHQLEFDIKNITTSIELSIQSVGTERDYVNNNTAYKIDILPDFSVHSVSRPEPDTIVADIREMKGISSAAIAVEFYLVENNVRQKIGSGEYDPNIGLPLVVRWPGLIGKSTDFNVEVDINVARTVKESYYANNKGAYRYRPTADLVVSNIHIRNSQVHVTVENQGTVEVEHTQVMLTSNPLVASQSSGVINADYNVQHKLDEKQRAIFSVPISQLKLKTGDTLFAVVNPLGVVQEKSRNNNSKSLLVLASALDGGEVGDKYADLFFGSVKNRCGNITVNVIRRGSGAVVYPLMRLENTLNQKIAQVTTPVISSNEFEKDFVIRKISNGMYDLVLSYYPSPTRPLVSIKKPISIEKDPRCTSTAYYDPAGNIVAKSIKKLPDEGGFIKMAVEFVSKFNSTNYRKPLTRAKVEVEVVQGLKVDYRSNETVYLPNSDLGHVVVLTIPKNKISNGDSTVIVRLVRRDDEKSGEDNTLTFPLHVGPI